MKAVLGVGENLVTSLAAIASLLSNNPDKSRARLYDRWGCKILKALFCGLSRSSLRYPGRARWTTGEAYPRILTSY